MTKFLELRAKTHNYLIDDSSEDKINFLLKIKLTQTVSFLQKKT